MSYDGGRDEGPLVPVRGRRRQRPSAPAVVMQRVQPRRWTDEQHRQVAERAARTLTPNQVTVLNALSDQPKSARDIAAETGLTGNQVHDAVHRLSAKNLADRAVGGKWVGW